MNINSGKTGTVNIPGALHSTGGDGDGHVGNVVAYAGDVWDDIIGKNQAEINATINNVSNLPLTSINGHVGSFKNIPKEDSNVVEADETIALGVGVFADKQRSFGWGSGYQIIFLTGSNSQYTIRMNGNSSAKQPFVALATAWVGGYILSSGTTHRRVAKVTAGNFSNGVLTITTNTDLGTLNDAKYTYECKTGQQNFCAGAFINSGRQNIAIGTSNFVGSDFSTTMGAMNGSTQNAKYSNTIGAWNNNDAKGTIVGNENTLKTENSTIVGTDNSITSNSDTPSSVLGYHNNIPSGHGALIGNDNTSSGDKGYALGEHNNLQYSGIALGHYNKDYTSNSDSEKNLFVVGNGTADNARSNSIEQKQDGNLFIKGVGGFDGTNSQSASTKSLQDVLDEIEFGLQSTIKLNEYNKVNVTYPTSEQKEGSILCNLVKNDEKILQDHSAWGSEFADFVRSHNVYIGKNFGNAGIEEKDFTGYIHGEEIVNVMNSDDKSTIVECFSSASDYWIVATQSELIGEDNLYASRGTYTQRHLTTPFSLQGDGNLFIKGVGGYNGDESTAYLSQPLQKVLNEIASGGVTSWNDLEDKPTILDSYDVRQIVLDKCPLHYDDSNYVSYIPNGSHDSYTLNTLRNTYNGIVLGKYNVTSGHTSHNSDESTVLIGTSNTNDSKNSVLIGDTNNNNQNKSVMLGSSNVNKSEGCVNIGNYNQNNGGKHSVMIGYDNTSSNSASTICLGSENRFSMSYYDPANQDIIAVGRGLYCSASGIVMGFYNVQDSVLEGDTANFLTIGDGSGNKYSATRSNIIEQRRNGDIYIKGIGNYNGSNSRRSVQDPYRGKSLQEVISGISASTESKLSQTPNNSLEFGLTNFVNNTSDSFAGGVGVNAKGDRAFGFGQTYMTVYVTGSGESDNNDEYPYSLMIGNPTGYTVQNAVAEEFAKTMVGAYLLDTTNNFHRYAIINSITYNGQNHPLSVKLDSSLGQKTNAVWTVENIGSGRTFSVGGYGNIGQYGVAMGNYAFNSGKNSIVMGQYNANGGQNSSVFGVYNHNSQTGGNLLGTQNTNTGQYSNVIGLQNTNSGQYANIIGRNNNNNCASTTIVGIANDIKETTYPSCIVGYNNSGETSTQQFTLGYENHGTRGQYAPANTSCTWMIGHNLITSRGGIAIGRYNKDYDVQDTDKQNFFVISQGDSNLRSNSFELKANGDLYVYGVGGFNGINSDGATVKTLQAKIAELEARIAQLEGGNS